MIRSAPVRKPAIRREIFGERPLPPMNYPAPAIIKTRRPTWLIILWRCLGIVCTLELINIIAAAFLR